MSKAYKIALYADEFTGEAGGRVGQSVPYAEFFGLFGEVMLVTSQNDFPFYIEHCDILALPGGADVDPRRYESRPHYQHTRTNPHYETMDLELLTPWVKTGKPIIGICRGLQTLNVVMGGTLHPNINGHNNYGEHRNKTPDKMFFWKDEEETEPGVVEINSFHHQAIKDLAQGFKIIGWGPMYKGDPAIKHNNNTFPMWEWDKNRRSWEIDRNAQREIKEFHGVIEAIEHTTLPYVAFQYHPEELVCSFAMERIIKTLRRYEDTTKIKGRGTYLESTGKTASEKKGVSQPNVQRT